MNTFVFHGFGCPWYGVKQPKRRKTIARSSVYNPLYPATAYAFTGDLGPWTTKPQKEWIPNWKKHGWHQPKTNTSVFFTQPPENTRCFAERVALRLRNRVSCCHPARCSCFRSKSHPPDHQRPSTCNPDSPAELRLPANAPWRSSLLFGENRFLWVFPQLRRIRKLILEFLTLPTSRTCQLYCLPFGQAHEWKPWKNLKRTTYLGHLKPSKTLFLVPKKPGFLEMKTFVVHGFGCPWYLLRRSTATKDRLKKPQNPIQTHDTCPYMSHVCKELASGMPCRGFSESDLKSFLLDQRFSILASCLLLGMFKACDFYMHLFFR